MRSEQFQFKRQALLRSLPLNDFYYFFPEIELQTYQMFKNQCQKLAMESLPTGKRVSSRLFVFEQEDTHRSSLIDIEIDSTRQFHDISYLFQRFCPLKEHEASIYHPETNNFCRLDSLRLNCISILPNYLLEPRIVLIRYKKIRTQHKQKQEDPFLIIKSKHEQKSKQRTVKQAIDLVQKWRKRYYSMQRDRNNCKSLSKIAQQLEVSKKTLDDYYYHLRVGQFYQFQFKNHLHQKISVLRNFVKKVKPKRETKDKYFRHPKLLKIINQNKKEITSCEIDDDLKQSIQLPMSTDFELNALENGQFEEGISKRVEFYLKYSPGSDEDNYSNNFQQYSEDCYDPVIKLKSIARENKEEDINNYFLGGYQPQEDI